MPTPQRGEDPLEQAAFLLAINQPQNALQLLDATPVALPTAEIHRKLQFRTALCLFAQNLAQANSPHTILPRLKQLANSPAEHAIATWLELEHTNAAPNDSKAPHLIAALQLPATTLAVDLPPTAKLLDHAKNNAIENVLERSGPPEDYTRSLRTPLKSLLLQQLQGLLNSSTPDNLATLLTQVTQLTDHDLCSLTHPSLTQTCLNRAASQLENNPPSETTLHLLFAAAENLQSQTAPKSQAQTQTQTQQFQTLQQLFASALTALQNDPNRSPFEQQLLATLLQTTARETLPQSTPQPPPSQINPAIPPIWQTIADTSWNLVPVSANGQINNRTARNIQPAITSDPVLSFCRWTSYAESSELAATPADHTTQGSWRLKTIRNDVYIMAFCFCSIIS